MMRHLFLKIIPALSLALLPVRGGAQGLQRYSNHLFAEYGFVHYNNKEQELLGENSNVLSIGLGYHKDVFGFLALGLKVKHYELAIRPGTNTQNANTAQFQFRLQRPRISRTFRLRRLNPYFEGGVGYATEYFNQNVEEYTAEYMYASLAAGLDYSFSDHWTLGVQGEYRLSGADVNSVINDFRNSLNPFNTVSARLGFYFGRNRKRAAVPRIYTRPATRSGPIVKRLDAAETMPAHTPAPAAAGLQATQTGTIKIADTVLMRIVNPAAVQSTINSEPVQATQLTRIAGDTATAIHTDTANRLKMVAIHGIVQDSAMLPAQDTSAGHRTILLTPAAALKQDTVATQETPATLTKEMVTVPQSDTMIRVKKELVAFADRDTLTTLKKEEIVTAGKDSLPGAGEVLKPEKDTTALYKRDTVWKQRRDTIVLNGRDTLTMLKKEKINTAGKDSLPGAGEVLKPERDMTVLYRRDTVWKQRKDTIVLNGRDTVGYYRAAVPSDSKPPAKDPVQHEAIRHKLRSMMPCLPGTVSWKSV